MRRLLSQMITARKVAATFWRPVAPVQSTTDPISTAASPTNKTSIKGRLVLSHRRVRLPSHPDLSDGVSEFQPIQIVVPHRVINSAGTGNHLISQQKTT